MTPEFESGNHGYISRVSFAENNPCRESAAALSLQAKKSMLHYGSLFQHGSMVKRLRRRPLKAKSGVRFPLELPIKMSALCGRSFLLYAAPRGESNPRGHEALGKRHCVGVFSVVGMGVIDHALACASRRRFPVNGLQPDTRLHENPKGLMPFRNCSCVVNFRHQGMGVIDHALACASRRRFPVKDLQPDTRPSKNLENDAMNNRHPLSSSKLMKGGFVGPESEISYWFLRP